MDKQRIEKLRKQNKQNPPEGMDQSDILNMSDDDLLDMDYFLHEDDDLDDDFGEEGFFIFYSKIVCLPCPSFLIGIFYYLNFTL